MDAPRRSPPALPAPPASLPSTTPSSAAVSRPSAAPAGKMTPAAASTSAPAHVAATPPRSDIRPPAPPAAAATGSLNAPARPMVAKPRPASTAAPAAPSRPAGGEARPPLPAAAASAAKPALARRPSHTAASTLQALASAASSAPQARPVAPAAKPSLPAAAGPSAAARLPAAAGAPTPAKKLAAGDAGPERPRPLGAGAGAAGNGAVASGSALKSKPLGTALTSAPRPAVLPGTSAAAVKAAPMPKPSPVSDKAAADKADKAIAKAEKAEKRRKANRACSACQKAHLTCDDSRPCQRCVKKGLQDSCTDGARKKAKYLLDEEEVLALKREKEERKKVKTERCSALPPNGPMRSDSQASGTVNIMPDGVAGGDAVDEEMHSEWGTESAFDQQSVISHMPAGIFDSAADAAAGMTSGAGEQSPDYFAGMSAYSPGIGDGVNGSGSAFGADPYGGAADVYQGPIEFGSETTSLEYSFLSSMLHSIDPHLLRATPDTDAASNTNSGPGANLPHLQMGNDSLAGWRWEGEVPAWQAGYAEPHGMPLQHAAGHQQAPQQQQQQHMQQHQGMPPPQQPYSSSVQLHAPHLYSGSNTVSRPATVGYGSEGGGVRTIHAMDGPVRHPSTSSGGAGGSSEGGYGALEVPSPAASVPSSAAATLAPEPLLGSPSSPHDVSAVRKTMDQDAVWKERVKHVYSDRCKPFPYTEGYHFLLKHVTAKFEKQEVLRIVRALAIFRPSLIALQMPLTEDDEVFVERSILRTVLELEKLISFSGTPTVVWRRTCEIAVVGMEFCMLTQRTRESLLGKYIYEFLDKASTLEYWEAFALHAFEASAQSIMMPVSLVGGSGNLVKCAACFSIKRDVFDLPSLVVANFLPIL